MPPLATANTPVTPVLSGRFVQFVRKLPAAGVPSTGVTSEGLVARTTDPVPVLVVTPVPPLVTARVPDTCVPSGNGPQLGVVPERSVFPAAAAGSPARVVLADA